MRPRTIAIVGAAIIAAGLILQQLLMLGVNAGTWASGTQLDQSLLGVVFAVGDLVARVAVPLGSAVVGGGLVLSLVARRPAGDAASASSAQVAATRHPDPMPPADAR